MDNNRLYLLQEAASAGKTDAILSLIDYYLEIGDEKKAFLTAQRFEYFTSDIGYKTLGDFYYKGRGVLKDIDRAISYFQKSFELGNLDSGYQLALIHIKNEDYASSLTYLMEGVNNDHIPSIKLLASLYLNGDGVLKNPNIAINLLNKAMSLGDKKVIHQLGLIYFSLKEYEKAIEYFLLAASENDLDAIYHLGVCYAKGYGVKQDFVEARKYYETAANRYEPRSLYNLSLYYRNGITVSQNIELANKLEKQAYDNGFKK